LKEYLVRALDLILAGLFLGVGLYTAKFLASCVELGLMVVFG
jgi:hypothetical protein